MAVYCVGVILAGGQSTRYDGRPKGLEHVGGRRIIDRVADALREVTDELLLIANDRSARSWLPGVRMGADVRANEGSLGGIHAAVYHAQAPALVVAWDMPFVPAALLARLRALGDGADVAVPESGSRRGVEPLCAYYGPACLAPIERRLAADDRRVISFFDDVRVARIPAEEVAAFGDPSYLFMNVNTPAELLQAQAYAASSAAHDRRPQA
ncbi:MAG: molybdenum cofactor guanylyltransferase [Gemmatimonadaceae bacterium]